MATEVERLVATFEATTKGFEKAMARAAQTADKSVNQIQRKLDKANTDISSKLGNLGKSIGNEFGRLGASAGPLGNVLSSLGKAGGVAAVGIGAAALALTSLFSATTDALAYAAAINDAAERTGVATDAIQELRYAFVQGGVSVEDTDAAIAKLNQTIGDAAGGVKSAQATFDALGISIRDAGGEVRPVDQILSDVADRLSRIEDPAQRAAAAADLFGRGVGTKMIGALSQGSAALADLRTEAQTTGSVISKDVVAQAAALDDQMAALALTVKAQTTQALVDAGPALLAFDTFVARLKIRLAEFAGEAVQGIPVVTSYFEAISEEASKAFAGIRRTVSPLSGAIIDAFAFAGQGVGLAIAGIGQAVQGLIEIVKQTINPIVGLFIGAYDGIVAAWKLLPAAFAEIIVSAMNGVIAGVEFAINQVADALNGIIGLANAAAALMGETLFDPIKPVNLGRIKNEYTGAGAATADAFATAFAEGMNRDWIGEAFTGLGLAAQSFIDNLVDDIIGAFERIKARAAEIRGEATSGGSAFQRDQGTLPANSGSGAPPASAPAAAPISYSPASGGGGGGGSTREKKEQIDEYLRGLRDEVSLLGLSNAALKVAQALIQAKSKAQEDFRNKLRESADLTAEETAEITKSVATIQAVPALMQLALTDPANAAAAKMRELQELQEALANPDVMAALEQQGITAEQAYAGVADAMSDAELAASGLGEIGDQAGQIVSSGLHDIASGAKTAEQALLDMVSALLDAIAQALIFIPLQNAITGAVGSLFGGGAGAVVRAPTQGVTVHAAKGGIFDRGNVVPFARGGIVNRPTLFPMATGAGLMGEAGPEAILPLARGAGGRLGVRASGAGGGMTVVLNDYRSPDDPRPETQQRRDSNGNVELQVTLRKAMNDHLASGGADQAMSRFGSRPQARR